jgi:hypothetical protein
MNSRIKRPQTGACRGAERALQAAQFEAQGYEPQDSRCKGMEERASVPERPGVAHTFEVQVPTASAIDSGNELEVDTRRRRKSPPGCCTTIYPALAVLNNGGAAGGHHPPPQHKSGPVLRALLQRRAARARERRTLGRWAGWRVG